MELQNDGALLFRTKNGIFIFQKKNYEDHCFKHEILKDKSFLTEIEKILNEPDTITEQKKIKAIIYYGILKQINNKYNIQVRVVRIPVIKLRKVNIILTAFPFWAYNWQVIHSSEKIVWQKPNSLLQ